MNEDEITEKAQELTIKNVTDGKNKYFSWGFFKGCVIGLEYNNKQVAELEEKISFLLSCKNCPENKGGLICAKEYENKCLAQKIQYIKELKKENAVLKERNIKDCKNFNRAVEKIGEQLNQKQYQLTKAKEIIKEFVEWANWQGSGCPSFKSRLDKAEQFLSEVKKC